MKKLTRDDPMTLGANAAARSEFREGVPGHEIQAEPDACDPLIPDGANLKANLMTEYDDVAERRRVPARLAGFEDRVWARVGAGDAAVVDPVPEPTRARLGAGHG